MSSDPVVSDEHPPKPSESQLGAHDDTIANSEVTHPLSEESEKENTIENLAELPLSPRIHGDEPTAGKIETDEKTNPLDADEEQRRLSFSSCSLSDEKFESSMKRPAIIDDRMFEVTITHPTKVGEGMSSYITYSINTRTNIPEYKKTEFFVTRRFSDFLCMHEKLLSKYMHLGRFVPPPPEKNAIGMAKVKLSKEENVPLDFIGKRKASLERYLNRIGRHPVLRIDPDFIEFIESPDDYNKRTNNYSFNASSFRRVLNVVSNSVSRFAFKFDEPDDWFEENQQLIDGLHSWCKKLYFGLSNLSSLRKDCVPIIAGFHRSMQLLSNAEENTSLSHILTHLTEALEKLENEYNRMSDNDFFILTELARDYVSLLDVVKDVFAERYKIFSAWQSAEETLKRKKEAKARYESLAKRDKIPQADLEILEWEAKSDNLKEEFDNISGVIKEENCRFNFYLITDFETALTNYFQQMLFSQRNVLSIWNTLLPEIKAADC